MLYRQRPYPEATEAKPSRAERVTCYRPSEAHQAIPDPASEASPSEAIPDPACRRSEANLDPVWADKSRSDATELPAGSEAKPSRAATAKHPEATEAMKPEAIRGPACRLRNQDRRVFPNPANLDPDARPHEAA